MNEPRTNQSSGRRLSRWVILWSIGIVFFASGWAIGAVEGFGGDSGQASTGSQKATDSDTRGNEFGMAAGDGGQLSYGVEGIVGKIARAAYEEDMEVLGRHASPGLKDYYGSQTAFEDRVTNSLESAPELTPGPVEVVDAAPSNLFSEAVFYRVALKDGAGDVHRIGIVFEEPDESDPVELSYCYLYVENEHLGRPEEKSGLWRNLVGNDGTCLKRTPESKPEADTTIGYERHLKAQGRIG